MPLSHWSSDSASTNITDAQSQILNAPPLVKSPAPPVIAPQCPESTSTSVTTTLDPTVRTKFHFCNHYRASEHFPIILCVSWTVTHSSPTPCAAPHVSADSASQRTSCLPAVTQCQTTAELLLNLSIRIRVSVSQCAGRCDLLNPGNKRQKSLWFCAHNLFAPNINHII